MALMNARVAILDYGCGNLASVANAVRKVGGEPEIVSEPHTGHSHVILPGQGAFIAIPDWTRRGLNACREFEVPILGICLGMQLMCEGSEEAPGVKGLGWLPYQCVKMPVKRLPHIGWNSVYKDSDGTRADYYFCHSYAAPHQAWVGPDGPPRYEWIADYEEWWMAAAIFEGNLWAVQFHPEKSGRAGLNLLAEFLRL